MKHRYLAVAACFVFSACAVQAQNMKPGLWEVSSTMGGNPRMDDAMAKMQAQLASMPPEQRKMVEDMMAKKGVAMSGGGAAGAGFTAKACITKEMAEKHDVPRQQRGDCTNTAPERTATGMKFTYTCTNPPSSGEGQVTYLGNDAYTMKMKITRVTQGQPEVTNMDATGKWLSVDCGDVKPISAKP